MTILFYKKALFIYRLDYKNDSINITEYCIDYKNH